MEGDHSPDNVKFPDGSQHSCQVKCYSYHAGTSVIVSSKGRNATVHDPKLKCNAQVQQSQEWMQIRS